MTNHHYARSLNNQAPLRLPRTRLIAREIELDSPANYAPVGKVDLGYRCIFVIILSTSRKRQRNYVARPSHFTIFFFVLSYARIANRQRRHPRARSRVAIERLSSGRGLFVLLRLKERQREREETTLRRSLDFLLRQLVCASAACEYMYARRGQTAHYDVVCRRALENRS